MKTKEQIQDKIRTIDDALKSLKGSGNLTEIQKLVLKAEILEWVLEIRK